jgi:TRAP-type C4-dicarboxylate transport system permease small subunit
VKKLLSGYIFRNIEEIITVFFLIIMVVFTFIQVMFRYVRLPNFTGNPIYYAEEITRLSYVWITFIGLSLATKNEAHISMTVFIEKLTERKRYFIYIFIDLISLMVLLYLLIWGFMYLDFSKSINSAALNVSMIFVTISFPLGLFFTSIRIFERIAKNIKLIRNDN